MKQDPVLDLAILTARSAMTDMFALEDALDRVKTINAVLLEALSMVRDADDDCKKDSLPCIPSFARARIDAAIAISTNTP